MILQAGQVMVLGLGASGAAAVSLLLAHDVPVVAVDEANNGYLQQLQRQLADRGANIYLDAQTLPAAEVDVCVISPGVSLQSALVRQLQERQVPLISELELGWMFARSRIMAITGSNGKSTCVKLCTEILRKAGLTAEAGGNYGTPLSQLVQAAPPPEWLVIEVSSFQLETVQHFCPDMAVLLNVQPNHLDRHGSMKTYQQVKCRLFSHMQPEQLKVAPFSLRTELQHDCTGVTGWTLFGDNPAADVRIVTGRLIYRDMEINIEGTPFAAMPYAANLAACLPFLAAAGVDTGQIQSVLTDFKMLPHRMEQVAEHDGVIYIDDSKATSLTAMSCALQQLPGNIRLIAGGLSKEKDFNSLKEVLAEKVICVYLIGNAAESMYSAWSDTLPCFICETLKHAVDTAGADAAAGDTVLLSPGCASFDQFLHFEERGNEFKQAVQHMMEVAT